MDEKIKKLFIPIVDKLYNTEPAGEPFRKPVDPVKYSCLDYYIYVSHPIDLSTIKNKIFNHEYQGDPWRVVADIERMFSNAFMFNKKGTPVYDFASKLKKMWISEINTVMQRIYYCCGEVHQFGPQLLFCHGTTPEKYCQIAIDAKYKCYQDSYSFCVPCFNRIDSEYISLQTLTCETSRMKLPTKPVKKSDFVDCTNDRWQYEAFIKCTQCSRRHHQICELYPADEEETKECPQHDEIDREQKDTCFIPPEFQQYSPLKSTPVSISPPSDSKPKFEEYPSPPKNTSVPISPLSNSQPNNDALDKELLAFAQNVDECSYSRPCSPNSDEGENNHQNSAKNKKSNADPNLNTDSRRSLSSYSTCSSASPNNRNSVDNIAARLSSSLLNVENQNDNERQSSVSSLKRDKFVCNHCYRKKRLGFNLRHRKFSARRLPHTRMSRYIETKVNECIRENSPTAGEVTVRVLTAYRDKIEVKNEMKAYLRQQRAKAPCSHPNLSDYPDEFEFTTRAIFAWQEIDGVEVCVFGMHVQEYGEECPEPNKQVVYLSYLDSVHFFRPKQIRTAVYHEILLSYFRYVKKLGFRRVFIWVCPSRKGDDYIFYRHPPEQKMPTVKRLSDWYVHLLDKGVANGIVERHQNIYEYAMAENWSSILSLPYLSGDYWPGEFERLLKIMIESQKEYDARSVKKEIIDESSRGAPSNSNDSQYLQNNPSLDQHNVLSLSNLYRRASTMSRKVENSGQMLDGRKPALDSVGQGLHSRDTSYTGDREGGDMGSTCNETEDTRSFETKNPSSLKFEDQPLDLSKSKSSNSPSSSLDDDTSDRSWREPSSRKKRRSSSSTMGYVRKRSRTNAGKSRSSLTDISTGSQKATRLKTGLRSSGDSGELKMTPEEEMLKTLERSLKRQKEGFIVVRLSECDCSPHFESLRRREEGVFTCDLMKGREPFLQLARLKNYEFSTLRRAKFSSLGMVKHLGEIFKLQPICNECFSFDSSKQHYVCRRCKDFYLCTSCHENTHHEHSMLLLPPITQPDIDEFLQQCPPISAANSISSASSIISNKSFNDNSPEISTQTPSKTSNELINDDNIPLNKQMSNGLGSTSSMPLGCKRQKNWALSLDTRTEDEENANFSRTKLSLSRISSPPPSHSSNRVRSNQLEIDQALIDNVVRQTELDHNIDFDEMKDESRKLLSHYFGCPSRDTCTRCKFVVLSCSFMSLLMRNPRMQMMINCHPGEMSMTSNAIANANNGNNGNLASDGINLTTNRRFG